MKSLLINQQLSDVYAESDFLKIHFGLLIVPG